MIDLLTSVDRALLLFVNRTLSTSAGDMLWPLITDYDKFWPVRAVLGLLWLWLVVRGGSRGRSSALLIIPVLFVADKLNSEVLKEMFMRLRPCHEVEGRPVVEGLRLLVDCGPGKSFPSSHAVNNFAVASVFASYYPKARPYLFAWAGLVAVSRVAVGVHYPSDVVGGALVGSFVGLSLVWCWRTIEPRIPWGRSGDGCAGANE